MKIKSLTSKDMPRASESTVLALDLGRRTGWCRGKQGKYTISGVNALYDEKHTEFTDGQRFRTFYDFLLDHLDADLVVFEQVAGGTKGRQTVLFNGYRATLLLWAQLFGKPVVPLAVGTIKKHVTGKGNASKEEMMDAIRARGVPPFDDNEADAIGAYLTLLSMEREK